MGLLDQFNMDDPQTMGLLSAAGNMLQSSGPSRMPVSFGQVLGAGLQGGLAGYQGGLDHQQKRKLTDMQLQNYLSEIEARKLATIKDERTQRLLESLNGDAPSEPSPNGAPQVGSQVGGADTSGAQSPGASPAPQQRQAGLAQLARQYGIPPQAIQADLAFNGGKGIAAMLEKHGAPNMQVTNGYAYDQNKLGAGFMPSMSTSSSGQTSMTRIGPDGLPVVSAPAGAVDTFGAYQNAQEAAKARYGTTKLDLPDGPRMVSNADLPGVLGGQAGASAGQRAGFDPSKLTPQQQAYLQRAYPQEYQQGVADFGQRGSQAGGPGLALQSDADRAGQVEQAKANVKPMEARNNALASANYMLQSLDRLSNHPGLAAGTGLSSVLDPRNYVPGTDAKNFGVALDQIKGGTFLQAFESLKGGGSVTEVEGTKATNAIARLNTAQSTSEFKAALNDFKEVMTGVQSRIKAAMPGGRPSAGGASGDWDGGTPANPATSGKTMTLSDIAATARASGKSTAEVTRAARAAGYTIGGQ